MASEKNDKIFHITLCLACYMPMADDDIRIGECPWCRSDIDLCKELDIAGVEVGYVHNFLRGRPKYMNINKMTAPIILSCFKVSGEGH